MKNLIFPLALFCFNLMFGQCPSTLMDIDSNVYNVVQIGNQCWMKENLKTMRYANGNSITHIPDSMGWDTLQTGAWCIYNNDIINDSVYGKLYNWWAVMNGASPTNAVPSNIQGVCPTNWHVPSESEWDTLIFALGGASVAGGKMKDTTLWNSPNTGADNSSGFSALPAGARGSLGKYLYQNKYAYWWSTREFDQTNAYINRVYYNNSNSNNSFVLKMAGYSVRCVKEKGNTTGNIQKDHDEVVIEIYPNPFNHSTTVYIEKAQDEAFNIIVYDISGKRVLNYFNLKNNKITLNMNTLEKGIYFMELHLKDKVYIEKLLIK